MLPAVQQKTFGDFYDSVRTNGILDPKTTYLLHLATAMAVGCVPCMEYYLKQKADEGVTDEEIGAVQAVVMAVSSGKVNAQLRQAERSVKADQKAPVQ
ncbi:MAG: carboxymuconolactone decarboxylase family protein [Geobacter sp.]|nr:carboxymuconolactone decarboxylase family protein [Geobacter sp.]